MQHDCIAEFVAENRNKRSFPNDAKAQDVPAKAHLVVALASLWLLNRLHENGLQDTTRGGGGDDRVAHTLDMKLRSGETGKRAFDTETDGVGDHRRQFREWFQSCRPVQYPVRNRAYRPHRQRSV